MYFDPQAYTVKELTLKGTTIRYRAFTDIPYVDNPLVPDYQKLAIYVPEAYYHGESLNGYNLETAPVFVPNAVGGYMPGEMAEPGYNLFAPPGTINSLFWAIDHGYVVVSPALRGRTLCDEAGNWTGKAPARLVDYKAAIRYLHAFSDVLPGDQNKIITNGTSAGGALSSLIATTIDHPDYEPYLTEIGAAQTTDRVLAASCYCPITNLEHADMAYEWQFNSVHAYTRTNIVIGAGGRPDFIPEDGDLTASQLNLSDQLKAAFPAYLNSLELTDGNGRALQLDVDGHGSYADHLGDILRQSAEQAGIPLERIGWLTTETFDLAGFAADITRMKTPPAFDALSCDSGENDLFGDRQHQFKHFTSFTKEQATSDQPLADPQIVKLMNPMHYIADEQAGKAAHIRIRHGQRDRDTSLAISAILSLMLEKYGHSVDYQAPWGVEHDGDYDLDQLFAWIDSICQ
ncbi:subtype B tannase [Streptococcus caprae]|uniref:Subtype B tannase n=1 Tax=Streptococcus caprae TaxID=1640501 RepID=A0ABV8CSY0_9STRE